MLPLGTRLPAFALKSAIDGQVVANASAVGKPVVVMFICNHCPYVQHLKTELAKAACAWQELGFFVVGINSNDVEKYPADDVPAMKEDAKNFGYTFPYLFDETQAVAKAFQAACTPEFYVFGKDHTLVYRGQFDDSRPGNGKPVTGEDVNAAVQAVAVGKAVNSEQKPSIGCNIKWRPGSEPAYFPT
jgi:thiol-disulfide isomerase/thioredoxin